MRILSLLLAATLAVASGCASVAPTDRVVDYGEVVAVRPVLVKLGTSPLVILPYTHLYDETLVKRYLITYRYVDQIFTTITTYYTDDLIQVYSDREGKLLGPTRE